MTGGNDALFARPQLLFSWSLRPTGQMEDRSSYREVSLVFFSTFEPISFTQTVVCKRMVFQCCMRRLPPSYQHSVSAHCERKPFPALSSWCSASSKETETVTHQCRTPLGMMFQMAQLPMPGQTAEPAFRGRHLDVGLWEGVSQKVHSGGCKGDEACSRVMEQQAEWKTRRLAMMSNNTMLYMLRPYDIIKTLSFIQ